MDVTCLDKTCRRAGLSLLKGFSAGALVWDAIWYVWCIVGLYWGPPILLCCRLWNPKAGLPLGSARRYSKLQHVCKHGIRARVFNPSSTLKLLCSSCLGNISPS